MKTKWDLTLLYRSVRDPRIERDVRAIERAYERFEKRYRTARGYLKSESGLSKALRAYERLVKETAGGKPLAYFAYRRELDSADQAAEANLAKLQNRLTKAANRVLFFELALGKLPGALQRRFLKSAALLPFRTFLSRVFEEGRYNLSEPEERVLNLKALPGRALWVSGLDRALSKRTVRVAGKAVPIAEAMNTMPHLKTKERRALHQSILRELAELKDFAESEINAVFTDKKIDDELRGFKTPYTETLLCDETDEETVLSLSRAVSKHFRLSRRFYRAKAKLLQLPYLTYADRAASVGGVRKRIPFASAHALLAHTFGAFDPRYRDILKDLAQRGQIDVFPARGKSPGAFCSGNIGMPTFVFLNYVNDIASVTTFAHEMGHAIHTQRSKSQRPLYQGYSTATAEVASTLFESLVFDALFEKLSERERVIALHDRIQDDVQTVFRQIAFFNFELELHRKIRSAGALSASAIGEMLNKHMRAYLGSAVRLTPSDGLFFIAVSHFRRFFYVYTYAYGALLSKALAERLREDPSYIREIDSFLRAGGSAKPAEIFKNIGIDTGAGAVFSSGLKRIERDLKELERLLARGIGSRVL